VLTFVTAIGGGTVRDLIIGSLPVAWLLDLELITAMTVSFFIALFFNNRIQSYPLLMFWFDSIGLAFFCMVAIDKGIAFNFHPIICIALGTITGSFGGIIRDVLLNEIPYVFRKDVKKGVQGACLYYTCHQNGISKTPFEIAKIVGIAEKFLSSGDRILSDLNERGIIQIPKIDSIPSYINRYFEF
jgi:uncharacterized membrane protein YeiH